MMKVSLPSHHKLEGLKSHPSQNMHCIYSMGCTWYATAHPVTITDMMSLPLLPKGISAETVGTAVENEAEMIAKDALLNENDSLWQNLLHMPELEQTLATGKNDKGCAPQLTDLMSEVEAALQNRPSQI
eukprot:12996369-Ditylum_brightwellii.AAC.1